MNMKYEKEKEKVLKGFFQENIQIYTLNMIPLERFSEIFAEEKRDFLENLYWDISDYIAEKSNLIKNKSLFGSVLIKDAKVIAYIIILPLYDFLYLNCMNILEEYKSSGLLEDLLFLVCGEIQQKDPIFIEGQPFLFNYDLDFERLKLFEKNHLKKTFMIKDLNKDDIRISPKENMVFKNIDISSEIMAEFLIDTYEDHPEGDICSFYNNKSNAVLYIEDLMKYDGCGKYLKEASFLLYYKNELIGYIINTALGPHYGHTAQIVIKKGYNKKGIGTYLMEKALLAFKDLGYSRVSLSVLKDIYTHNWYLKQGFEDIMDYAGFRFLKLK